MLPAPDIVSVFVSSSNTAVTSSFSVAEMSHSLPSILSALDIIVNSFSKINPSEL